MSAASQRTAFQPPAAEILMFAGDGVMAADRAMGARLLICNRAAEEIFGYPANEILGLFDRDADGPTLPPGTASRIRERSAPRAGRAPTAGGAQRKHGGEVPLEATLSRREIEGRTVLIAIVRRDATEREAERLLMRELEHRMKNAFATVRVLAAHTLRSSPSPRGLHRGLLRPPGGAGSRPFAAAAA